MARAAFSLFFLLSALFLPSCSSGGNKPTAEPFEVVEATIADIQEAITSGRASCREIVQAHIDRIEAYDKSKSLNAITVINPKALERADEIDAAIGEGRSLGPLFCAPLLVKDNFDTHDLPTTAGSIVLKDNIPPDDAFMVRKIRAADAIVLAKTNMAEWAFSPRQTISSSYGVTANAYALDRVPAGSSGGTASGVAASFGVAGLGSDTGNSIRGPSSHLALFGIRSTIGLTSRGGVVPLVFDRDIAGPMARTVEDAARIFNVVAGHDPNDLLSEEGKRADDYLKFLDPEGLKGARVGVLRALAEEGDDEILTLFGQALADMRSAGAELVDPVTVEDLQTHTQDNGFCPSFRYDMRHYFKTLGDRAPLEDVMVAFRSGQFSAHAARAFAFYVRYPLDLPPEQWDPPCPRYLEHPLRRAFLEAVTAAMDEAQVEVLVYPSWTYAPAHLDRAVEEYRGDNSQLVAPATGMPAATVPMGYSHGNLPAGLQILARRYDEGAIFKIAYAYQQTTRHRRSPEEFPRLGTGD